MARNVLLDESKDRQWPVGMPDLPIPTPDRKPPAILQSREPKSIRFTPIEWDAIARSARQRGLEPAVFARMLTMYALIIVQAPTFVEASAWVQGFGGRVPGGSLDHGKGSQNGTVKTGSI